MSSFLFADLLLQLLKNLRDVIRIDMEMRIRLSESVELVTITAVDIVGRLRPNASVAYVITTSGTTGLPKIVRVPHHCIVPNIVDIRSVPTSQISK